MGRAMRTLVPPVLALAMAFANAWTLTAAEPASVPAAPTPAFTADGNAFVFDTGVLKGQIRPGGRSIGLCPLFLGDTAVAAPKGYGLLSPYRLLSADARYGTAAWDWASRAALRPEGAVEVRWAADDAHPFDLVAVYRWAASDALDLYLHVVARKDLPAFEVFLASYFEGCPESLVYVKERPGGGGPGFMPVAKEAGDWQAFPRDDAAARLVADGRWQRPPHPVAWKTMPQLAGALAMRRDPVRGVVALVMAPPGDCFAVLSPHGEESHRSLYLSLIGGDVQTGEDIPARARLVVGKGITEAGAIERYDAYLKEAAGARR
jgi:hypothetical protein